MAVSIVSLPPFGIASRALTARLIIALSSWLLSAETGQRPPASTVSILIVSSKVRRSSSDMPETRRLMSSACGDRGWRRAKARSCWVSAAARSALRIAGWTCSQPFSAVMLLAAHQPTMGVIEATQDDLKQIVEIVRDPAGELAQDLDLLQMTQNLLGLLASLHLERRSRFARREVTGLAFETGISLFQLRLRRFENPRTFLHSAFERCQ